MKQRILPILLAVAVLGTALSPTALAEVNPSSAAPTGVDYFQFSLSPYTGSDNTGDGGGSYPGNPAHTTFLNYYYVGQQFTTNFLMTTAGSSAANIVINYTPADLTASNLQTGNVFGTWSGQAINATQILSTGFNASGSSSSGSNTNFGSVRWTVVRPTELFNSYTTTTTADIEEGVYYGTLNSNISLAGLDIMDDEEDGHFLLWADVTKPYAHQPNPANGVAGVLVESNYAYQLCDSKDGEAADAGTCMSTGVGTGVNTAAPPGVLTFNDGSGAVSLIGSNSFACSGTWNYNQCNGTVNPASPLGIAGDLRNWDYSKTYTVNINSFQDRASSAQNQLGEANGPNTMNAKSYTFTTEADVLAPFVQTETPLRGSLNVPIAANIVIDVVDRKGNRAAPQNISGTGVVQNSCRFNVTSLNGTLTNLDPAISPELLVTPPVSIPYGIRYTIDPTFNFAQNETVSVSVHSCQDVATNTITTDNYTFVTVDLTAPNVTGQNPADNAIVPTNQSIQFTIQDSGVGVDLNSVVIYLDGQYYTRNGGAGVVTSTGTQISFPSSLWFDTATNGVNYAGDTTQVTGTAASYSFTIDPQTNFTNGEIVPIIIYAKDLSSNNMQRVVYSVAAGVQLCGNSAIEGYEVCDDGNNVGGDGCSADCSSNETCGNGITELLESCDDGNVASGDGCSATCAFEGVAGGQLCGNSAVEGYEVCDDGNNVGGDGCSANCTSNETCGNGITELSEACDDGNVVNGDGCSATCAFETTSSGTTTGGGGGAGGTAPGPSTGGTHGSAETEEPGTTTGGTGAGGAEVPEETELHGAGEIQIPLSTGTEAQAGLYWYESLSDERLRAGDEVSFMIDGQEQSVLIREIGEGEVVFEIPGVGIVTVPKTESFAADLNGDGIADIIFEVKNINSKLSESLIHLEQAHFVEEKLLTRTFEMDEFFSGQVAVGDMIIVSIGTQKHVITVTALSEKTITFTIQSEPKVVEVSVGAIQEVDITGEGVADLAFTFKGLTGEAKYGNITIRKIEPVKPPVHLAPGTPTEEEELPGLLQSMGALVYEISKIQPLSLLTAILILSILLGIVYIRWMQLRNKKILALTEEERVSAMKGQKIMKTIFWMIVGAIVALAVLQGVMIEKNRSLEAVERKAEEVSPRLMNFAGTLIDPATFSGVGDVDITAGNVTIRTEKHGAFAFYDVPGKARLNHPGLLLAIEKKVSENDPDIYFNIDMFNLLIRTVNEETAKVASETMHAAAENESVLRADHRADQTLLVGTIQKIDQGVDIEVITDTESKIYTLTFDGERWYLLP